MRKVLVVLGHPDAQSFNHAIFDAYVEGLDRSVCEVETLDLGALDFDPVMRFGYRAHMPEDPVIERSQELLRWADHITFIFPTWWHQLPSLLKGWVERVLTPGFAYNMGKLFTQGHLEGRTATLIVTTDAPVWGDRLIGSQPIPLMRKHILGGCGIKVTTVLRLGRTRATTDAIRTAFLDKVRQSAAGIRQPLGRDIR